MLQGLVKKVGNGYFIYVWVDPWVDINGMRVPLIKNMFINIDLKVADLIDPRTKTWDRDILQDLFYPGEAAVILRNKPVVSKEELWSWKFTQSGDYNIKS